MLGFVIVWVWLNLESIIVLEIFLRARSQQTSQSFPILIVTIYEKDGVPFVEVTDARGTTATSSDICQIEVCLRDVEAERRSVSVDTTLVVDMEALEAGLTLLALTPPSLFTITSSSTACPPPSTSRSILT